MNVNVSLIKEKENAFTSNKHHKHKLEQGKEKKLGLNLTNMVKNDDYQDEFMSNYEN